MAFTPSPSSSICASCLRAARIAATSSSPRIRQSSSKAYSTLFSPQPPPPPQTLYRIPRTPHKVTPATSFIHSSSPSRRPLATATDPKPTAQPARPVLNPRTDSSGNPMRISLSPRASHRLHAISTSDANPNLALRITIESGGCHGFQYLMSLTDLSSNPATEEDTVFEGDRGEKIVVDESSLELLNGSTVDYTMELIGSQFKVTGIPGATSSCGCGTSFDIKF